MKEQNYLFIGDRNAILFQKDKNPISIKSFEDIAKIKTKSINLIINTSDLDIACIEIPKLSFFDRQQFAKQRLKYKLVEGITGSTLFKDHIIELNCPLTPYIEEVLGLLSKHRISVKSIRPFLLFPDKKQTETRYLIISDHEDHGLRQTAFIGQQPLFTRLSKDAENLIDEIHTTITYLNNHYFDQKINLIAYAGNELRKELTKLAEYNIELQVNALDNISPEQLYISRPLTKYKFSHSQTLDIQASTRITTIYNTAATIATVGLLTSLGWQYNLLEQTTQNFKNKETLINNLRVKAAHIKNNNKTLITLPKKYSAALELPSPIQYLQQISTALPENIIVPAFKWERSETEEKIRLSLYIINDDITAAEAIRLIKSFANELMIRFNNNKVSIISLPFKSADHETFVGSLQDKSMQLVGEKNKAELEIVWNLEQIKS